jgi:uncharacterized protein YegP (UPF0339 family)
MTKLEIFKDRAGQYRWRLIARNGEIVAASEAYVSKSNAERSAQFVKAWASSAQIVDVTISVFGVRRS